MRVIGEQRRLQRLHLIVDGLCCSSKSLAREVLRVGNREVHDGERLSVHVRSTAEIPTRFWEGNGLLDSQSVYRSLNVGLADCRKARLLTAVAKRAMVGIMNFILTVVFGCKAEELWTKAGR